MHVFLTGATGYVGSHVLQELLSKGHQVSALTRRESQPSQKGLRWISGSLKTLGSMRPELKAADVIIHCAMEYKDGNEASEQDLAALKVMQSVNKFLIMTGNLYNCATGLDGGIPETLEKPPVNWRNKAEIEVVEQGNGATVRLGFVYGGTGGYLWEVFKPCSDKLVFYTGDGTAAWPMVHVADVARLYRFIAESQATGVYHGWDGTITSVKSLLHAAAQPLGARPVKVPLEEARQKLGGFADRMLTPIHPASGNTAMLGWKPLFPSFELTAADAFLAYESHRQAAD